jgi:peptidyl-tRNA hydrolase
MKSSISRPGKVAAQCAHAACGAVEVATKRKPEILDEWRNEGQAKVSFRMIIL